MKKNKLLNKIDIFILSLIVIVYSLVAFFNLGDTEAPENYYLLKANSKAEIVIEKDDIESIKIYLGAKHIHPENSLEILAVDTENDTAYYSSLDNGNVFYWNEVSIDAKNVSVIEISSPEDLYITEMSVINSDGLPARIISAPLELFDEEHLVPNKASYKNGTYFDEIYHARTAYEFTEGLSVYEWTHPPLGKSIISLGIDAFGMNPFGWRVMGTLFGILMIPVIYVFLKKMLKETWVTASGTLLFTFDFMHFAQTRIATIDVYITFFIMLMYYYMYKYYTEDFSKTPMKSGYIMLALSGLFMGLGVATKWTGAYAGIGLAVLFFITCYKNRKIIEYRKNMSKTIGLCFIFFGAIPLVIYILSYIPFLSCNGGGLAAIWQNQIDMLAYHGKTVLSSEHYFASPWYEWPIDARPIWYYAGENGDKVEVINSFGNPLVWWTGLIALVYCIYDAIKNKDKTSQFLVISYFAQLLPWVFVERLTFIYHYFPCVPFLVLMTGKMGLNLYNKHKFIKPCFIIFTILAITLFIWFYPILSGYPIDSEYVIQNMRWLSSWHFTN